MRFEHGGLAAGLLVRVLWALTVEVAPLSDSHAYDTFARMMVDHDICGWEPDEPTPCWPVDTAAVMPPFTLCLARATP